MGREREINSLICRVETEMTLMRDAAAPLCICFSPVCSAQIVWEPSAPQVAQCAALLRTQFPINQGDGDAGRRRFESLSRFFPGQLMWETEEGSPQVLQSILL